MHHLRVSAKQRSMGIRPQLVKDGIVKSDSRVSVDFSFFGWNQDFYARNKLPTDPEYLSGIRLRVMDDLGKEWPLKR